MERDIILVFRSLNKSKSSSAVIRSEIMASIHYRVGESYNTLSGCTLQQVSITGKQCTMTKNYLVVYKKKLIQTWDSGLLFPNFRSPTSLKITMASSVSLLQPSTTSHNRMRQNFQTFSLRDNGGKSNGGLSQISYIFVVTTCVSFSFNFSLQLCLVHSS